MDWWANGWFTRMCMDGAWVRPRDSLLLHCHGGTKKDMQTLSFRHAVPAAAQPFASRTLHSATIARVGAVLAGAGGRGGNGGRGVEAVSALPCYLCLPTPQAVARTVTLRGAWSDGASSCLLAVLPLFCLHLCLLPWGGLSLAPRGLPPLAHSAWKAWSVVKHGGERLAEGGEDPVLSAVYSRACAYCTFIGRACRLSARTSVFPSWGGGRATVCALGWARGGGGGKTMRQLDAKKRKKMSIYRGRKSRKRKEEEEGKETRPKEASPSRRAVYEEEDMCLCCASSSPVCTF